MTMPKRRKPRSTDIAVPEHKLRSWIDQARAGVAESSDYETENLRISVHHHIHHPPDRWLLSVTGALSLVTIRLAAKSLEDAKDEALGMVRRVVSDLAAEVDPARGAS